jgi:hypothetical protein
LNCFKNLSFAVGEFMHETILALVA